MAKNTRAKSTRPAFPDIVRPFQIEGSDVRGRLVRLGPAFDMVLSQHDYPPPVARLMGETLALAAVLAATVKYDGVFNLQAKGSGPVDLVVADVDSEGGLRGYARYDKTHFDSGEEPEYSIPRLMGTGHLAFTVDQGPDTDRYQGITPLEGASLSECAQIYFRTSEQLETAILLAAELDTGASAKIDTMHGRAGALLVQRLPDGPSLARTEEEREEDWRNAVVLMSSLSAAELLNPDIPSNGILYRLYHEKGVRVFNSRPIEFRCRCSRDKIAEALASFSPESLIDMKTDAGVIVATCEFCHTDYKFDEDQIEILRDT
ncbi:MAG: Hsp33 family molecular chaperone HslO [Rhodospirillales bacterium]|jgi:molecular chaperone Hsp33|nr:molecular chaperone Hsp33 [Rhodospirillaceae bacterium]MDP6429754.1 Hsp33 family molecular chaperone HslO [Rhodospirillales bacterium]MDP6642541.1 Hsp33 family molecular chaperone HslO [Rhodospirillales bacterium]|tara:strand:- start:1136 stop:2089 length:954 start_codon:yes stop_codon:yes gene_type:complete